MPTTEQPAATGKRVRSTDVMPIGMSVTAFLHMMLVNAIITRDSGRHKHQRANYSRDEANSV